MASNYSLQVENVRFDPTRLLALEAQNIANAETEHRAAEAAYGEIQSKADMFEKLANDVRGKDSQAYQNYINYANTLRQHTDLLATQGVNPALWRNLLQAKSDYSRIIHPIEEAYQARDKEAERQAKYLEQHPHAMFERDAYDMGIDQWMKNPHYRAKSIDREVVANRAMERYKALQSQIMEMVSQSGLTPDAIKRMTPTQVHAYVKQTAPWLYEAMEKRGVSPEEVQRFMTGDSTAINSLLTSVMDETLGMYGLNTWNTDYDHYTAEQNRLRRNDIHNILRSTIEGEAPNAIGESKFTNHTDTESYKWADLAERKRQFDINDAWRKNPNNPDNIKKLGGSGGGKSQNAISITVRRDNFINNGMTRDEANKAVIQEQLPEELRNEGVMKILKSKGYDTKFLNGELDLKDKDIVDEIKKAYDNGEGDISYLTAAWARFKNFVSATGKLLYKGAGTTTKVALSPVVGLSGSLTNMCYGVYHGLIKGDMPVGQAFSTDWTGYGSLSGIGDFITSNDFLPGLGNDSVFEETNKQFKKEAILYAYQMLPDDADENNGIIKGLNKTTGNNFKNKHEVSMYLNNEYEIDDDALKMLEETNEIVGYDPQDTRFGADFVYSLGVSSILRNPEDYMVNAVTNAANDNWSIALNNFNQNAVTGAFTFSNMDGSKLDDDSKKDIEDAAKSNTLTASVYTSADKNGKLKNEIVILAGKDDDGNDKMFHSQLPRDGREVIQDNLNQSLKMNEIASDHKAYKNLSQSEKNAIKDNFTIYYAHENGIDNEVSLSYAGADAEAGARSLYNSLARLNYIRRPYEELTGDEKEELIYKYMAQKLAGSFANNAMLAYFTTVNSGFDQAGSTTGTNYDKSIVKNDYINYQYR
jgi:hypothetical protein